jgi:hypothetical protein
MGASQSRQALRQAPLRCLQRGHCLSILSRTDGASPRGMKSSTSSTMTAKISRRSSPKTILLSPKTNSWLASHYVNG